MEFKVEVSRYKETEYLQIVVMNEPSEFCCETMLDLYQESYGEKVSPGAIGYGGIGIVASNLLPDYEESCVELMFVFESGRKRTREAYEIHYCPFCGEEITVKETHIPSSDTKEKDGRDNL